MNTDLRQRDMLVFFAKKKNNKKHTKWEGIIINEIELHVFFYSPSIGRVLGLKVMNFFMVYLVGVLLWGKQIVKNNGK